MNGRGRNLVSPHEACSYAVVEGGGNNKYVIVAVHAIDSVEQWVLASRVAGPTTSPPGSRPPRRQPRRRSAAPGWWSKNTVVSMHPTYDAASAAVEQYEHDDKMRAWSRSHDPRTGAWMT
jgi:hypothetical protein